LENYAFIVLNSRPQLSLYRDKTKMIRALAPEVASVTCSVAKKLAFSHFSRRPSWAWCESVSNRAWARSSGAFSLGAFRGFGYTQRNDPYNSFSAWREIGVLSFKASLVILFSAALIAAPPFAAIASSTHAHSTKKSKSHKLHGQQAIEPSRVLEIQQALIREHYLTGEPNGSWDATTQAALQKFQSDQGWQTRLIPDSRALKKLGLGPDYSGAINAEGASFNGPAPASSIPPSQAAGFAAAAGVNQ
jgi:hypothetical protein